MINATPEGACLIKSGPVELYAGESMNIRLAGFGGQGIVLGGYLLGCAGVGDGGNALQTQSYGSESRGGACKSDVVISEGEIMDLAPADLDALIVLTQPALDKYLTNLKPDGLLIFNSDMVKPGDVKARTFGLSATSLAREKFGSEVVTNVIMLGCLAGLTQVVSSESLKKAIAENVPPKTIDLNLKAFDEGFKQGTEG